MVPTRHTLIPVLVFLLAGNALAQGHDRWHQKFSKALWHDTDSNDVVHLDLADINGDGEPDLLYADPHFTGGVGFYQQGRVLILDGATGDVLFEYVSPTVHSRVGYRATFLDDIDGDGIADFAFNDYYLWQHHLYLYSGATLQPLNGFRTDVGYADIISVGDRTGDGLSELVAIRTDVNPVPGIELLDGSDLSSILRQPISSVDLSLRRLGDLDGDGLPEIGTLSLLPAAPNPQSRVLGGADLLPQTLFDPAVQLSWNLADAGDVDGDGTPDLLAGNPWRIVRGNPNSGVASVISGATGVVLREIQGFAGDQVGGILKGIGDLDQDGFDDYLLGSRAMSTGNGQGIHVASVRLYSGFDHSEKGRFHARSTNAAGDRSLAVVPATSTQAPTFAVVDPKMRHSTAMLTWIHVLTYGP